MQRLLFLLSVLLLYCCSPAKKIADDSPYPFSRSADTVRTLAGLTDSIAVLKTTTGNYYPVFVMAAAATNEPQPRAALAANVDDCATPFFTGEQRKQAKTSVVKKKTEVFSTLTALRNSLPADMLMRNYTPRISHQSDARRNPEEKRVVKVKTVYIYAIYREPDNDYHMIIGSTKSNPRPGNLLTVEISGLPATHSGHYTTLKTIRQKVDAVFGELKCGKKHIFKTKPVPVSIKGSLFYDIGHAPGIVGPTGLRPNTSWEIHPVTGITFK